MQFLAHLVNQVVVHELVALHLLTFLLNEQSDDSVELAVRFVKVCIKRVTRHFSASEVGSYLFLCFLIPGMWEKANRSYPKGNQCCF